MISRHSQAKPTRAGMVLGLALLTAVPAFGNTLTVTSTADSGTGSLRDAIASASNGDTINFSLGYPAIITVATPLTFGPNLTIVGPGAQNLAISGGFSVGVLVINAGATVAISGITIELGSSLLGGGIFNAGTLSLSDSSVFNNLGQLGAGIFNAGTLTLSNSTVSLNTTVGAGIPVARGGGIYNSNAMLTVINSAISRNSVAGTDAADGGGIFNDAGSVMLTNSTVSENVALVSIAGEATGGGISNGGFSNSPNPHNGFLILTNSTVSGNSLFASFGTEFGSGGGGISNGFPAAHGVMQLINSTISGNSVTGPGGGGGIRNDALVSVTNSTIFGNSANAGASGGGIFNARNLTVSNSTVAGNSIAADGNTGAIGTGGGIKQWGTTLTVKNSIVASNTRGNCAVGTVGTPSTITSGGYNLSDDGNCANFFIQPGDLNNTPADLDPAGLKNNGGPTQTIALLATSFAVDAIPVRPTNDCTDVTGNPVSTDQRGVPRPQGPRCDIGAFERFYSPFFLIEAVQTFLLIDAVQPLPLPRGRRQSLVAPLEAAVDSLNLGVAHAAINHLEAFVDRANAFVKNDRLTSEQATPLIVAAQQIIQSLVGPNP